MARRARATSGTLAPAAAFLLHAARLNEQAARIADAMVARALDLGLRVSTGAGGETVVDCGRPGAARLA
jgi:hypothetical protein